MELRATARSAVGELGGRDAAPALGKTRSGQRRVRPYSAAARRALLSLRGRAVSAVAFAPTGAFAVEFVQPGSPSASNPGEALPPSHWQLRVYCAWRVDSPTGLFLGRGDPVEWQRQQLETSEWGRVQDVTLGTAAADAVLRFESGVSLRIFGTARNGRVQWTLVLPDGTKLRLGQEHGDSPLRSGLPARTPLSRRTTGTASASAARPAA